MAEVIEILLVEDNEGDIVLTLEAFRQAGLKTNISVVRDGEVALEFLNKQGEYKNSPTPDIVLLDINLPTGWQGSIEVYQEK